MSPKLDERIAAAELKLKQMKVAQQRAVARQRSIAAKNARSQEVRRNVLVGAIVRAKVAAGEINKTDFMAWLETRLTRDDDRALFDLAPTSDVVPSA